MQLAIAEYRYRAMFSLATAEARRVYGHSATIAHDRLAAHHWVSVPSGSNPSEEPRKVLEREGLAELLATLLVMKT